MTHRRWSSLAVAALAAGLIPGCTKEPEARSILAQPADSPRSFSEVGPFSLTERSGATVSRDDLLGRPWVASFVFTRCTGPCPRVVSTLKILQGRLKGAESRIVTFTVDPQWDTPEVLGKYADGVGADRKRWLFLTGDEKAIDGLILSSFQSPVARNPAEPTGSSVTHNTRLVAVDRKGRVRGYYHGESDSELDLLVARLRFLEREVP